MNNWRNIVALVVLAFISNAATAQCAMCKLSNENGDKPWDLNTGIYILMTVPYIILFLLFRKKIIAFFKDFKSLQ